MLFKTDTEIKAILTFVNASFKLDQFTSAIKSIERDIIKDVLGETEYIKLELAYNDDTMSSAQTAILVYVQETLAFHAFLKHIPYLNVDIGTGGLRVNVNTSKVAASQFRTEDLKSQVAFDAYNSLENLISFLWASGDAYPDWKASTSNQKHRQFFINTASEFSQYVDINNSAYLFSKIKANVRNVEQSYLKAIICCDLFDAIKAEIVTGTISEKYAALLVYIKPAVANYAFMQAVASKAIAISNDGTVVEYIKEGTSSNIKNSIPARNESISQNMSVCSSVAEENLKNLKDYLYAEYETYSLFTDSDCYDSDEETANISISEQNSEDDTIVFI